MALTKRQKMLLAVFFVGLVALGVDRIFLRPQSGPAAASANAFDEYAVQRSPAPRAAAPAAEAQRPGLGRKLERIWPDPTLNATEARDPFSLVDAWSDTRATAPADTKDSPETFARAHPLEAVVVSGRQSYISIDDRVLKLGEQIEGYTLVSVGPKSAVFERQGERVVVELSSK